MATWELGTTPPPITTLASGDRRHQHDPLPPTSTPRPMHAACHPPPAYVQLWSHQFISSVTAWHTTGREFLVPPSFVFVYSVRVLYKLT